MTFRFFRRQGPKVTAALDDPSAAPHSKPNEAASRRAPHDVDTGGLVTYAMLLDAQKCVRGYRLAWRPFPRHREPNASENFRALLSCVATNLNAPKTGWRLGGIVIFLDVTVDALLLDELQDLPPENVVLCMDLDDLTHADTRPMLLLLRARGFGFMLRGADVLPEDPEVRSIVSHVDVGDGHPDLVASLRRDEQSPDTPVIQPIATHMATWQDFDACATRGVDVFVPGRQAMVAVKETGATLQPEALLIVRLMQMIQRNEDVRIIEAALKHDPALTYRLLRYINSPGVGLGVEIQSIRHAVAMLGYAPLFRWLSLMLATSNKASSAFMAKKAIARGRFVELMGQGMLPSDEADNLFVAGMFSLIDRLLGVSMEEVLDKVQLSESVRLAIQRRGGMYGPFVALAESCELDDGAAEHLSESLFMSAEKVNAAHLSALAWAQDVTPAEVAY